MRLPTVPRRALLLLAIAALLAPAARGANDAMLSDYALLPTEHDDQGRSDEPDRAATSVLGPLVVNCVAATSPYATPGLGRACTPDASLPAGRIAPGCTDDQGRQPSGLCALWSQGVPGALPPHVAGVRGMGGDRAPGALTPSKGAAVRLLDVRADALPASAFYTGGARMLDVDHKLADLPGAASLGPALTGPTAFWAWYGVWRDANGNGVIDALPGADNEFVWVGGCGGRASAWCIAEPGLRFPLWVWPGDHHQGCGMPIGCLVPSDAPGAQAVCFAGDQAGLAGPDSVVLRCDPQASLDAEQAQGDPLLGPAGSTHPDLELVDDTGQGSVDSRVWRGASAAGSSPPAFFYDQSLLGTTLTIGGTTLGSGAGDARTGFDLGLLQFTDVDRYTALTPLADALLQGAVKPVGRAAWVTVREAFAPALGLADSVLNNAALDLSPSLGPVQQQVLDPGWAREPNTALDVEPGAVWHAFRPSGELPASEQDFRGWLNDMSGYAQAWHAFADVHAERVDFTYGAFHVGPLQLLAAGGALTDTLDPLLPRGPGEHARALEPGAYRMRGVVGAWRDAPQAMDERVLDPLATLRAGAPVVREDAYALPPDGWLGNVVNTTGGYHSRGYADTPCTIGGQRAVRAYSVCNPYLDDDTARVDAGRGAGQGAGIALSDPQDSTSPELLAPQPPAQPYAFVLTPAGGAWSFPVLVWRDFYDWTVGDAGAIENLQGTSAPIVLSAFPGGDAAHPASRDLLILPVGALCGVQTRFDARVRVLAPARGADVDEAVRDVDAYQPWLGGQC